MLLPASLNFLKFRHLNDTERGGANKAPYLLENGIQETPSA